MYTTVRPPLRECLGRRTVPLEVPSRVVDRWILWCVGEALALVRCQGAFSRFRAIP